MQVCCVKLLYGSQPGLHRFALCQGGCYGAGLLVAAGRRMMMAVIASSLHAQHLTCACLPFQARACSGHLDDANSAARALVVPSAPMLLAAGGVGGVDLLSLEPPQWLPDSFASSCGACRQPFRAWTRLRHHCRMCATCPDVCMHDARSSLPVMGPRRVQPAAMKCKLLPGHCLVLATSWCTC
jgi:hypothetical protein